MDTNESSKFAELQQRLKEAEKNTILAATYGKELLEENHELHTKLENVIKEYATKIEAMEQEKYSLSQKLETHLHTERSLALELEQLREQHNIQIESMEAKATLNHDHEHQQHVKKVSNMEATIENQQMELSQMKERMVLQEAQLKEAQERLDMCNSSIHEQSTDEATATMQSQIMTLTCEKQELEVQVSSLTALKKADKYRLAKAEKTVSKLEAEVEEKECQCTSYYNALEKNKEEMQELNMEIESLRLAETDPARKGNSLFAEVEDHRQAMEKQLLKYKTNYTIVKKQCELKAQQIHKMKLQVASLLCLSNNRVDGEYLTHLEESLASTRSQLEIFTKRCQELETQQVTRTTAVIPNMEGVDEDQDTNSFFQNMYGKSQKKIAELGQELHTAQFDKVVLSDQILQLQRKLRQAEGARDATNAEIIRLTVKLEEMASEKNREISPGSQEVKRVVEKIPGFEKLFSTAQTQISLPMETVPLKEKLVNPNTMQEVERQTKSIDANSGNGVDLSPSKVAANQENEIPSVQELKKRQKKSVHMTETVTVQEYNGDVQELKMKIDDGEKKVERKRKAMRKMEAPPVESNEQLDGCKQQ
ncbi:protein Spindly-B-like [Homarus americanus]|uniref:protein Spindly-B-like n=1 Tax=Homarus americanus TaxID=6706 RepID=UPI001C459315|nr:protein Spindly-B-like [Homarus americanus]XP_042243228.1 protein Spindly-B-like [Homarus americanus]